MVYCIDPLELGGLHRREAEASSKRLRQAREAALLDVEEEEEEDEREDAGSPEVDGYDAD